MALPQSLPSIAARPPLLVVGVEQEWSARSLETVLGPEGFAVVRAHSGRQTLALAEAVSPDVVLVDSRLSDLDGLDVCRALRRDGRLAGHVPLVLMTSGAVPREFLREAYQAGVWSVWEQPLDGELLVLRLRSWIAVKQTVDVAERGRTVEPDTGLYTFQGLQRRAGEMVADANRRKTPVSCIAIGAVAVDHATGDERAIPTPVLEALTSRLSSVARGSDCVGQVATGEFAILAPMTERAGAQSLVTRVRQSAAELPPLLIDAQSFRVTIRAGLATLTGQESAHAHGGDLLVRASTALRYASARRVDDLASFDEVPTSFV